MFHEFLYVSVLFICLLFIISISFIYLFILAFILSVFVFMNSPSLMFIFFGFTLSPLSIQFLAFTSCLSVRDLFSLMLYIQRHLSSSFTYFFLFLFISLFLSYRSHSISSFYVYLPYLFRNYLLFIPTYLHVTHTPAGLKHTLSSSSLLFLECTNMYVRVYACMRIHLWANPHLSFTYIHRGE